MRISGGYIELRGTTVQSTNKHKRIKKKQIFHTHVKVFIGQNSSQWAADEQKYRLVSGDTLSTPGNAILVMLKRFKTKNSELLRNGWRNKL